MPANLTPEYKRAEEAYRRARGPRERLEALREMLRTIPKHKGTEHLQADIKSRIRELTEELEAGRRGPRRGGPSYSVRPEGAAQVALLGPPNGGKSTLHARLTGSHAEAGPFPFTTQMPLPGMLPFEDIHFQIVDLPPVAAEHTPPWLPSALQNADAALLVLDLADPEAPEQAQAVVAQLAGRRITLSGRWPGLDGEEEAEEDVFRLRLPTLLVANKADRSTDPEADVAVLEELAALQLPALAVSAERGDGLARIAPFLFRGLGVVRVYTKAPGREPDRDHPFTVRRGDTVRDVARLVHKELAERLRYARIWGSAQFDGQQVGPDHLVADGDVVELHAR
ncbi:TGS domain-containing protein [Inmirania thermothiophila]|uniref:TGS domain-containing protein n=1 Tax=Inmirania thermothiophila TaxID=1750597 RepID=A0A3N1Y862_9GAMM|nr:TGS domain-containing protein [Inmirania thermothiophila]ROR34955.1 hypothetical protein EDC57_0868 [Inmirania thermothiophila]